MSWCSVVLWCWLYVDASIVASRFEAARHDRHGCMAVDGILLFLVESMTSRCL